MGGWFRYSTQESKWTWLRLAQHILNTHRCQHLLALKQNHDEEYHKPSNDNLHFTETKQSRKELPLIDYISDVSCRCLLSIKQRDPSSTSHACFSLAVLSYGWANQGVTDWRFSGIKKLHQLPEGLQAKTKTSSQNNLKNFLTSYLTTACIEPEYYSVSWLKKAQFRLRYV